MTRNTWVHVSLTVLAAVCSVARGQDSALDADRAFNDTAAERGQQAAFQEYLAPDGVLFRPTAVNGRRWLDTHVAATGSLAWTPTELATSCTGNLAATTGPWSYRDGDGVERATGHYLTIWGRDGDGSWRVLLDHGIDDDQAADAGRVTDAAWRAIWPGSGPRACPPGGEPRALDAAEQRLNAAVRQHGWGGSLRPSKTPPTVLVYRDGRAPAAMSADWPAANEFNRSVYARTQGVVAAPDSDLAYSYGEIVSGQAAKPALLGIYVRLWRRTGAEWQVAADLVTQVTPEEATTASE